MLGVEALCSVPFRVSLDADGAASQEQTTTAATTAPSRRPQRRVINMAAAAAVVSDAGEGSLSLDSSPVAHLWGVEGLQVGEPFQKTWQELETCPRLSVVQPPVQLPRAAAVAAGPDARAAPEVRNNAFRNWRGDRPSAASGPRSSLPMTSRQSKSNYLFLSLCSRAHPSCY